MPCSPGELSVYFIFLEAMYAYSLRVELLFPHEVFKQNLVDHQVIE